VSLIYAAKHAPPDLIDRTGHDAAIADFGQWALVRVPAQGVLAPDDAHSATAIQEIAKRHLLLDVARAEVKEALLAIDSFETRDPIETAYNHVQSVYDDAYYYAGLACGITLMSLGSAGGPGGNGRLRARLHALRSARSGRRSDR
jgi:hypothetical protein